MLFNREQMLHIEAFSIYNEFIGLVEAWKYWQPMSTAACVADTIACYFSFHWQSLHWLTIVSLAWQPLWPLYSGFAVYTASVNKFHIFVRVWLFKMCKWTHKIYDLTCSLDNWCKSMGRIRFIEYSEIDLRNASRCLSEWLNCKQTIKQKKGWSLLWNCSYTQNILLKTS